MLLIDDLVLASFDGLIWIAKKIDEALEQEQEQEEETLKARLQELHRRLEAGQLGEPEFEAQEAELLDRLDAVMARKEAAQAEEGGREDAEG